MRATVLTALIVLAAGGSTASGADTRAQLSLVKATPLTLAGSGFAGEERVTLVLRAGERPAVRRTVRASGAGRFRASFGLMVALEPCEGSLVVTATGSEGSRATWKRVCRPPSRAD